MIRTIYASDQPYNDFPSLHTSLSTIIALHWWRFDRRIGVPAAIWTALIVASTVLVNSTTSPTSPAARPRRCDFRIRDARHEGSLMRGIIA